MRMNGGTMKFCKKTVAFAMTAVMLLTASCYSREGQIGEQAFTMQEPSSAVESQWTESSPAPSSVPEESSSSNEPASSEPQESSSEAESSVVEQPITKVPVKQVADDVKKHEEEPETKPSVPAPPPEINRPEEKPGDSQAEDTGFLVYLSPSKQFTNYYENGGNEGQYMNLVAKEMIPYLKASGVGYILADPNVDLYHRAEQSDAAGCDLYLSIHSNAANKLRRGTIAFYKKGSSAGKRFADILTSNFRQISPTPNEIVTQYDPWEPNEPGFIETREPKAPAVLIEVAYHDNAADAAWIRGNVKTIAANLAMSVTETLGVPFCRPGETVPVQSVTLSETEKNLVLGASFQLDARVSPSNASGTGIKWSSSDGRVATVENGKVTGVGVGTAMITATAPNGKKASCKITVTPQPVLEIKLSAYELLLFTQEGMQLTAEVIPKEAEPWPLKWSSSDDAVVSVDGGWIEARKEGKAVITVSAPNGVSASCVVTVKNKEDDICNQD